MEDTDAWALDAMLNAGPEVDAEPAKAPKSWTPAPLCKPRNTLRRVLGWSVILLSAGVVLALVTLVMAS